MNWLQTHKHLALALIIAGACLLVAFKLVAHFDGVAHDERVIAEEKLKQDQAAQKAADLQAVKDRQAYDALKSQLDLQNAALRSQITTLMTALASRQNQDRALPPSELAQRWTELIGGVPGDIKPLPDGLLAPLPAARQTVVLLEEIPVDRQTIGNQEKIIANDKAELSSLQTAFSSTQDALDACRKTQVSQDAACKAAIAEVKASARKRSIWYSVISFVAGAIWGNKK